MALTRDDARWPAESVVFVHDWAWRLFPTPGKTPIKKKIWAVWRKTLGCGEEVMAFIRNGKQEPTICQDYHRAKTVLADDVR
jgi:hypothetical protein